MTSEDLFSVIPVANNLWFLCQLYVCWSILHVFQTSTEWLGAIVFTILTHLADISMEMFNIVSTCS